MDVNPTLPMLPLILILWLHLRVASCANYPSICIQTPYPKLCNSLTTNTSQETLVENSPHLHHITSLKATLARGEEAHDHISKMDFNSLNKLEKLAWIDCLELYQDTIHQLNRTISSKTIAYYDAETWLSAAIANHETCQNGFHDFNLSTSHFRSSPFIDLSKLLSNSLALNKARVSYKSTKNQHLLSNGHGHRRRHHHRRYRHRHRRHHHRHYHNPNWASAQVLDASRKADIVVAHDGTGDYKTISEALGAVAKQRKKVRMERLVIYVKRGVYVENVEVKRSMRNVMMIGDGIDQTVVTASKSVQDGSTTFRSATFGVSGDGFVAIGMTFRNTAGPEKHQAVALRSSADHSVFYNCSFDGYQDTLYVHSQRQFYRDCQISGTVDFIFGDAASIFQNCNIYLKRPLPHQTNTVTAQGRKSPMENTGIVLHNSIITAAADLIPVQREYSSYLGRPWRKYSRTVVIKCRIDGAIDPAGWIPWNGSGSGDLGLSSLYYGEYMNTGDGARTEGTVKWPGFHVIRWVVEASRFAVGNFYDGESWIAAAGVPYTAGL